MTVWIGLLVLLAAGLAVLAVRLGRARRQVQQLRAHVARLEGETARADEARQRFLASVTHELRTPLTAILGYQELLADGLYGEVAEGWREPLARLGSAAEHLLHLVDGVLELTRLDAGHLELDLAPVHTAGVFRRVVDRARSVASLQDTGLEATIPEPLPRITTDQQRLEHALNLTLLAAVRASPGRSLHVQVRAAPGDAVVATVDGTGLRPQPPDTAAPAAHGTDTPVADDAGGTVDLHLAIALRLLRRLGATLAFEPDGDERTRLRLRLADAPLLARASASD